MCRRGLALVIALGLLPMTEAAPRLKSPDRSLPLGKWRVEFKNGVIQTSTNKEDGPAYVTEPGRTSPGKWDVRDRTIVITFDDDRLERWRLVDMRWVVEHWCPSSAYPHVEPVVGIAVPVR
jgi:hypothetical protein